MTYLIATAFNYTVHRIAAAVLTAEPATRSSNFNLDTYIAQGGMLFGSGENISLEAHISEDLAHILRETPIAEDMVLVQQGEQWRLSATLADSWQLRWWVLSQGTAIKVLAPQLLREAIVEELTQALAAYP